MYYDLLAKIKNAQQVRKETLLTPFSKLDFAVAKILVQAGYLKDAQRRTMGHKNFLEVKLSYKGSQPALSDFRIKSKSSRRLYIGYRSLRSVKQGYGLAVLSTPKGALSNTEARKSKVGGEYLFEVW